MRLSPAFATVWSGAEPLAPSCRRYLAIDDCILRVAEMEGAFWQQLAETNAVHLGPGARACAPRHCARLRAPLLHSQPYRHPVRRCASHPNSIFHCEHKGGEGCRGGWAGAASQDGRAAAAWILRLADPSCLRRHGCVFLIYTGSWAAQLRLGLQLPTLSDTCHGCHDIGLVPGDGWHSLSCSGASGRVTARHDEVVKNFVAVCPPDRRREFDRAG